MDKIDFAYIPKFDTVKRKWFWMKFYIKVGNNVSQIKITELLKRIKDKVSIFTKLNIDADWIVDEANAKHIPPLFSNKNHRWYVQDSNTPIIEKFYEGKLWIKGKN